MLQICAIILLCISLTEEKATNARLKRDIHIPSLDVPTFRRDSVEAVPQNDHYADRSSPLVKLEEFGSRSLPLRSSIESIPDL